MASGLPIVASPVNGIPFEIEEGKNGFFSDYGNLDSLEKNIIRLIDNPIIIRKISLNNIKKAQNYRWDNIYLRYMKEYKSLLSMK